jgi:hypothetical protein
LCEGRPQAVTQQTLECLSVSLVDGQIGVQRVALEDGAAWPAGPVVVCSPRPTRSLARRIDGSGLIVKHGLSVVVDGTVIIGVRQELVHLRGHPKQEPVDVVVAWWGKAVKLQPAVAIVGKYAVWEPAVKVRRELEDRSIALTERNSSGQRLIDSSTPSLQPLPAKDRAQKKGQNVTDARLVVADA